MNTLLIHYTTYSDLPKIRRKHKDKKIVFCTGTFDLTHAGHVLFFEECKKHGDILVVGLGGDRLVKAYKGSGRPILNHFVRLKMILSLKPVDYCLLDLVLHKDPHYQVKRGLKDLKPDIYCVTPEAYDLDLRKKFAKEYGVKLTIAARACPLEFENISTSKIIEKIKKLS